MVYPRWDKLGNLKMEAWILDIQHFIFHLDFGSPFVEVSVWPGRAHGGGQGLPAWAERVREAPQACLASPRVGQGGARSTAPAALRPPAPQPGSRPQHLKAAPFSPH